MSRRWGGGAKDGRRRERTDEEKGIREDGIQNTGDSPQDALRQRQNTYNR